MQDGNTFGNAILEAVLAALQPLKSRISELEKQLAETKSLASTYIDRSGNLVAIYSNGEEKSLGPVTTKGEDGKDGSNGFDLSNFDIQLAEDGRTINFHFEDEERKAVSSITLPTMVYRGVWNDQSYLKGDTVTHQGSLFVALENTDTKPGVTKDWQLAAKRGRDGKGV